MGVVNQETEVPEEDNLSRESLTRYLSSNPRVTYNKEYASRCHK